MAQRKGWDDTYYVKVYEFVRSGLKSNRQLAKALGVDEHTFNNWRRQNPALEYAITQATGKEDGGKATTFSEYIYDKLPPKLQQYWDELEQCEDSVRGYRQARILQAGWSERTRKHLFVYAVTQCNFNLSQAGKKVNVSQATYRTWVNTDPSFVELMEEIHVHKKNFFENALVQAVKNGETPAILFANRTINRDRGYSDKQVVAHEHSGVIEHKHTTDITTILTSLPIEIRQAVLTAIRNANAAPALPAPADKDIIEGELVSTDYEEQAA